MRGWKEGFHRTEAPEGAKIRAHISPGRGGADWLCIRHKYKKEIGWFSREPKTSFISITVMAVEFSLHFNFYQTQILSFYILGVLLELSKFSLSALHSFLQLQVSTRDHFSSAWSIFCLLQMCWCLILTSLECLKTCLSPSFWSGVFAGPRLLGWQLFSISYFEHNNLICLPLFLLRHRLHDTQHCL